MYCSSEMASLIYSKAHFLLSELLSAQTKPRSWQWLE